MVSQKGKKKKQGTKLRHAKSQEKVLTRRQQALTSGWCSPDLPRPGTHSELDVTVPLSSKRKLYAENAKEKDGELSLGWKISPIRTSAVKTLGKKTKKCQKQKNELVSNVISTRSTASFTNHDFFTPDLKNVAWKVGLLGNSVNLRSRTMSSTPKQKVVKRWRTKSANTEVKNKEKKLLSKFKITSTNVSPCGSEQNSEGTRPKATFPKEAKYGGQSLNNRSVQLNTPQTSSVSGSEIVDMGAPEIQNDELPVMYDSNKQLSKGGKWTQHFMRPVKTTGTPAKGDALVLTDKCKDLDNGKKTGKFSLVVENTDHPSCSAVGVLSQQVRNSHLNSVERTGLRCSSRRNGNTCENSVLKRTKSSKPADSSEGFSSKSGENVGSKTRSGKQSKEKKVQGSNSADILTFPSPVSSKTSEAEENTVSLAAISDPNQVSLGQEDGVYEVISDLSTSPQRENVKTSPKVRDSAGCNTSKNRSQHKIKHKLTKIHSPSTSGELKMSLISAPVDAGFLDQYTTPDVEFSNSLSAVEYSIEMSPTGFEISLVYNLTKDPEEKQKDDCSGRESSGHHVLPDKDLEEILEDILSKVEKGLECPIPSRGVECGSDTDSCNNVSQSQHLTEGDQSFKNRAFSTDSHHKQSVNFLDSVQRRAACFRLNRKRKLKDISKGVSERDYPQPPCKQRKLDKGGVDFRKLYQSKPSSEKKDIPKLSSTTEILSDNSDVISEGTNWGIYTEENFSSLDNSSDFETVSCPTPSQNSDLDYLYSGQRLPNHHTQQNKDWSDVQESPNIKESDAEIITGNDENVSLTLECEKGVPSQKEKASVSSSLQICGSESHDDNSESQKLKQTEEVEGSLETESDIGILKPLFSPISLITPINSPSYLSSLSDQQESEEKTSSNTHGSEKSKPEKRRRNCKKAEKEAKVINRSVSTESASGKKYTRKKKNCSSQNARSSESDDKGNGEIERTTLCNIVYSTTMCSNQVGEVSNCSNTASPNLPIGSPSNSELHIIEQVVSPPSPGCVVKGNSEGERDVSCNVVVSPPMCSNQVGEVSNCSNTASPNLPIGSPSNSELHIIEQVVSPPSPGCVVKGNSEGERDVSCNIVDSPTICKDLVSEGPKSSNNAPPRVPIGIPGDSLLDTNPRSPSTQKDNELIETMKREAGVNFDVSVDVERLPQKEKYTIGDLVLVRMGKESDPCGFKWKIKGWLKTVNANKPERLNFEDQPLATPLVRSVESKGKSSVKQKQRSEGESKEKTKKMDILVTPSSESQRNRSIQDLEDQPGRKKPLTASCSERREALSPESKGNILATKNSKLKVKRKSPVKNKIMLTDFERAISSPFKDGKKKKSREPSKISRSKSQDSNNSGEHVIKFSKSESSTATSHELPTFSGQVKSKTAQKILRKKAEDEIERNKPQKFNVEQPVSFLELLQGPPDKSGTIKDSSKGELSSKMGKNKDEGKDQLDAKKMGNRNATVNNLDISDLPPLLESLSGDLDLDCDYLNQSEELPFSTISKRGPKISQTVNRDCKNDHEDIKTNKEIGFLSSSPINTPASLAVSFGRLDLPQQSEVSEKDIASESSNTVSNSKLKEEMDDFIDEIDFNPVYEGESDDDVDSYTATMDALSSSEPSVSDLSSLLSKQSQPLNNSARADISLEESSGPNIGFLPFPLGKTSPYCDKFANDPVASSATDDVNVFEECPDTIVSLDDDNIVEFSHSAPQYDEVENEENQADDFNPEDNYDEDCDDLDDCVNVDRADVTADNDKEDTTVSFLGATLDQTGECDSFPRQTSQNVSSAADQAEITTIPPASTPLKPVRKQRRQWRPWARTKLRPDDDSSDTDSDKDDAVSLLAPSMASFLDIGLSDDEDTEVHVEKNADMESVNSPAPSRMENESHLNTGSSSTGNVTSPCCNTKSPSVPGNLSNFKIPLLTPSKPGMKRPVLQSPPRGTVMGKKGKTSLLGELPTISASFCPPSFFSYPGCFPKNYCIPYLLKGICEPRCSRTHKLIEKEDGYKMAVEKMIEMCQKDRLDDALCAYESLMTLDCGSVADKPLVAILQLCCKKGQNDKALHIITDISTRQLLRVNLWNKLFPLLAADKSKYKEHLLLLCNIMISQGLRPNEQYVQKLLRWFLDGKEWREFWSAMNHCRDWYQCPLEMRLTALQGLFQDSKSLFPMAQPWIESQQVKDLALLGKELLKELTTECQRQGLFSCCRKLTKSISSLLDPRQDPGNRSAGMTVGPSGTEADLLISRILGCFMTNNWAYLGEMFVENCQNGVKSFQPHLFTAYLDGFLKKANQDEVTSGFRQFVMNSFNAAHRENIIGCLDRTFLAKIGVEILVHFYLIRNWKSGFEIVSTLQDNQLYEYLTLGSAKSHVDMTIMAVETCVKHERPIIAATILERCFSTKVGQFFYPTLPGRGFDHCAQLFVCLIDFMMKKKMTDLTIKLMKSTLATHPKFAEHEKAGGCASSVITHLLRISKVVDAEEMFRLFRFHRITIWPHVCRALLIGFVQLKIPQKVADLYLFCKIQGILGKQNIDTVPRSVMIDSQLSEVEIRLVLHDYLSDVYNLLCGKVVEGKPLAKEDFQLHVIITSFLPPHPDHPFLPPVREEAVGRTQQSLLRIMRTELQPPLRVELEVSRMIMLNWLSVKQYIVTLDNSPAGQGILRPVLSNQIQGAPPSAIPRVPVPEDVPLPRRSQRPTRTPNRGRGKNYRGATRGYRGRH